MDDTYIEKDSFKKYYLVYIGATFLGMIVIIACNVFLFETSNSMSLVITMIAAMSAASSYVADVKRKMTKAEKKKLILNTFLIGTGLSIALSGLMIGGIYYLDPNDETFQAFKELNYTWLIIIFLVVGILYYLMHVFGCSLGNNYKEPKENK